MCSSIGVGVLGPKLLRQAHGDQEMISNLGGLVGRLEIGLLCD